MTCGSCKMLLFACNHSDRLTEAICGGSQAAGAGQVQVIVEFVQRRTIDALVEYQEIDTLDEINPTTARSHIMPDAKKQLDFHSIDIY